MYLFLLLGFPFIRYSNRIKWRFGRPYKCSSSNYLDFVKLLQPGMVILSHKNYEFTNIFIGGFWTHAAIVSSDGNIVEAIGKGVINKDPAAFFSAIDDFIVLKPDFCQDEEIRRASRYATRVVGFDYNFTFRPCRSSFTCADLIYRAYNLHSIVGRLEKNYFSGNWKFFINDILRPESLIHSTTLRWKVILRTDTPDHTSLTPKISTPNSMRMGIMAINRILQPILSSKNS